MDRLHIRKATEADLDITFQWANDPAVRRNSFQSEPIPEEDHRRWFLQKVNSVEDFIFIFEREDHIRVGLVRFHKKPGFFTMGLVVAPEFRGRGLSARMMVLAIKEFRKQEQLPIIGEVKQSNKTQIKNIQKVGFQFRETRLVDGFQVNVYEYAYRDRFRL